VQVKLIRPSACGNSSPYSVTARLVLVLAMYCLSGLAAAQYKIEWPAKLYNPKAAEGDVVMPMPCGGAMVFRRVEIESKQPLDDIRVTVGNTSDEWGYAENPRSAHLSGAFSTASSARYFLIGKYEVSALQYQAVTADECPKPNMKGRLPQTRVGWFDAIDFTYRYSLWLHKHAADLSELPNEDGEPGFVRLPTEDEWEYAARGGAVVSLSDFREKTYPMPGGIARHVWYAGTASANGKAQITGLLGANPLGLHDMLGNVDEITLDLFRLNHLDRMHGQVGGYVVRGGNYFTPAAQIRSAYRQEAPFYKKGEPLRSKTSGFRVVVSTTVITTPARLQQISASWNELGTVTAPVPPTPADKNAYGELEGKTFDDPVAELAAIARATDDKKIKQRIDRLRNTMRVTIEARNQQRDQAARESLRLGGVLCHKQKDDGQAIKGLKTVYKNCVDARGKDHQLCTKFGNKLEDEQQVLNYNLGIYAESIMGTAQNYPAEILGEQLGLLGNALKKRKFKGLVSFAELYFEQASAYASDARVRREDWFAQCNEAG
jgi:formylglycine-generating enzyme required for sulfatase activity